MQRIVIRMICSCALLLFFLVSGAFILPAQALAHEHHAVLLRSDPTDGSILTAPPAGVRLLFSEQVQILEQSISVFDPAGASVTRGSVTSKGNVLSIALDAKLTGTYLVSWRVISLDTDPASGQFLFSISRPSGIWANTTSSTSQSAPGVWLQVLARWIHFVGFALGFGPLALRWFVLIPLKLEKRQDIEQRLERLVNFGLLTLLLAEPVALLAQTLSLGSGTFINPYLIGDILSSSFGRVMAQRLGATAILWVLMGIARQSRQNVVNLAALAVGLLLALVDGEASHVLTSRLPWLGLITNTIHIMSMGIWIGGLIAFLSIWRIKALKDRQKELLRLFTPLAAISLFELMVTGFLMAGLHFTQPADLFTTTYGIVLTIKLLIVLLVLLLAIVGRRTHGNQQAGWWIGEVIALIIILITAGLLVSLPPPI